MDKRLFEALVSVSAASAGAKQLAEQMMVQASPALVKQLYAKITVLESMVAELTSSVNEPEEVSDEEAKVLADNLQARIKDVSGKDITKFDLSYIRMYPKFVRSIVATVLRNQAITLGVPPRDEWLDVIALGGEIK